MTHQVEHGPFTLQVEGRKQWLVLCALSWRMFELIHKLILSLHSTRESKATWWLRCRSVCRLHTVTMIRRHVLWSELVAAYSLLSRSSPRVDPWGTPHAIVHLFTLTSPTAFKVLMIFQMKFTLLLLSRKICQYVHWKPEKRRLLTEEEYRKQGEEETLRALDELRKYCNSRECSPWKAVSRLQSPKRCSLYLMCVCSYITFWHP